MSELEDVLFEYVAHGDPKSNEHVKRFLRQFPERRPEIIALTATWRALSILEKASPCRSPIPLVERQIWQRAQARWRVHCRRQAKEGAR